MQTKLLAFSRSYEAALSRHLKRRPAASPTAAHRLGLQAVKLGLETLDLARIHEDALIALVLPHYSSRASDGMVRRFLPKPLSRSRRLTAARARPMPRCG